MKNSRDEADAAWQRVSVELDALLAEPAARASANTGEATGPLVGEIVDTHQPHLPGRVFVRWAIDATETREAWLHCTTQVIARRSDRVLLVRPANFGEWIVTAVLTREPASVVPQTGEVASRVVLDANEALRIDASDGTPLVEIQSSNHGPVLRVLSHDLELAVAGRLRLSADTIECISGQGGTDLRSDGELVMRSPRIRLN
jgi:hypothetical protein